MHLSWLAIVPPLVTIICAVYTKRIIPSLVLGLIAGSMLKAGGVFSGFIKAADYLAGVLNSADNILIILFLFSFGALTATSSHSNQKQL